LLDKTLVEKKYFYNNGDSVNEAFCLWLFSQKNYIAICHNFKGFDSAFVMNYIINNLVPSEPAPFIINTGSKILGLIWKKVRCVDSFCFLLMPLSEFSSTFNLKEAKGYFPHFWNTKENQNYVGALPDPTYFGVKYFNK
jgi:hypothetical protein